MEHKLSIIIPLFNSGKHICRCLDSILELPMHKEVIVVDDGSTDSSHSLALKYAERGDIRLFSQENKGVSEARNLGLDNASGDIIAFVDSDDYILGDGFLSLYGNFAASDAEMAMGGVRIEFPDNHTETRQALKTMTGKTHKGCQCFANLMKSNTFTPLVFCYLFRKSFIDSSRLRFCHKMSEDDLWTSKAMCEAGKILTTDDLHYVYCKHADSITGTNAATLFRADNHIAVANDLYDYLLQHNVDKEAEVWLCCKILYIASIALKIYRDCNRHTFSLKLEMYQDLLKRVMSATDGYAKKVGLMFGMRIIDTLKSIG